MSLTLYVVFEWQFWYEVKSCRIFKNLWLLTSYKNCESKELASREWVSKIINLNLVDIRFSINILVDFSSRIAIFLVPSHIITIGLTNRRVSTLQLLLNNTFSQLKIVRFIHKKFDLRHHRLKKDIFIAQYSFLIEIFTQSWLQIN